MCNIYILQVINFFRICIYIYMGSPTPPRQKNACKSLQHSKKNRTFDFNLYMCYLFFYSTANTLYLSRLYIIIEQQCARVHYCDNSDAHRDRIVNHSINRFGDLREWPLNAYKRLFMNRVML